MKKVQKTLTGAMAAVMATGMATPVMAATDVDAIYKAAYNATMKALETKTQAAVNEARTAIKALPATLESAIGEFSKQVDTVQHPILVNIVTAIKIAQEKPTQANVNAAKATLAEGLPQVWLNSYSSAIDEVQQGLMDTAMAAVKLAETSKKAEDIEAAKKLVADLATATSEGIKNFATGLQTRVDAVKLYDLKVTKVKSVDRYQVEVEFDALTESLKDIVIEVVDGKGKVHQVSNKSLLKGSKSTKFDFKSLVGVSELTGVWTVNGVKYDVTEATLVKAVLNNLDTDIYNFGEAIAELQDEGYVEGVLGKYNRQNYFEFNVYDGVNAGTKYIAALKAKKTEIKNASDVQAVIDTVNGELAGDVTVEKLITLAKDSSVTSKQFFTAMTNIKLEKVNEDWASEYKSNVAALNNSSKLKDVQEAVYSANKSKITDKLNVDINYSTDISGESSIKLNRTKAETKLNLVEAYYKDDAAKVTEKADLVEETKIAIALLDVKAVKDVTDLDAALKNLSEAVNDGDKFSYEKNINENIMENYFKGIWTGTTTKTEIEPSVLKAKSVKEVKDFAKKIQANIFAGKASNLSTSGNILADLTVPELGLKNVIDTNKDAYSVDKTQFANKTSYDDVQAIVDAINARVEMTNATTKEEMRTALVTLVEKNGSAVLNTKTTAQIDDLAQEFLSLRDKKDSSKISLDNITTTLGTSYTKVNTLITTKINAVNNLPGLDRTLENAQNAVTAAQAVVDTKVLDVTAAEADVTTAEAAVTTAEAAVTTAQAAVITAQAAKDAIIDPTDTVAIDAAQAVVDAKVLAVTAAEAAVTTAEAAVTTAQTALTTAQTALTTAQTALTAAITALTAAETALEGTDLVKALEAIVGENKIKSGMLQDFIKVSNKDHKDATTGKYTYENYTQIRKALGL